MTADSCSERGAATALCVCLDSASACLVAGLKGRGYVSELSQQLYVAVAAKF